MRIVNRGEVWMVDFGMAAKVRPALILVPTPAEDELDLVTVLIHTTALRGNRWSFRFRSLFKAGRISSAANSNDLQCKIGAAAWRLVGLGDWSGRFCVEETSRALMRWHEPFKSSGSGRINQLPGSLMYVGAGA